MSAIAESVSVKKRSGTSVNAYLVLRHGEKVLLSLRQNTGYFDGYYGLVAGHVEEGEPASAAIIREAQEEANLIILPESLKIVHVMHRKTDRFNMDMFFESTCWDGDLINLEPGKCAGLNFFSSRNLPDNLIPYIGQVLRCISQGIIYSEEGWIH